MLPDSDRISFFSYTSDRTSDVVMGSISSDIVVGIKIPRKILYSTKNSDDNDVFRQNSEKILIFANKFNKFDRNLQKWGEEWHRIFWPLFYYPKILNSTQSTTIFNKIPTHLFIKFEQLEILQCESDASGWIDVA